jgi:hypothetical protein
LVPACSFYLGRDFELKSVLLGIILFDPPYDVMNTAEGHAQLSAVIKSYILNLLSEFGFSGHHITGGTTDAGSDVKCTFRVQLSNSRCSWCIPHLQNCGLVEAFESANDKNKFKNPECRKIIDRLKKVLTFFQSFSYGKMMISDLKQFAIDFGVLDAIFTIVFFPPLFPFYYEWPPAPPGEDTQMLNQNPTIALLQGFRVSRLLVNQTPSASRFLCVTVPSHALGGTPTT